MSVEAHPGFRPNRLLSRPLSSLFLSTPVRPNHITALSAACGVIAGMLFSHGTYGSAVCGALSYQAAVVLDNCDGEVARAKNLKSAFGAWFDILADFVTDLALFSGLAMGLHRMHPQAPALLLGLLCAFGGTMHLILVIAEKNRGFGPAAFSAPNPDLAARGNALWNLFDGLREGEASWLVLIFAALGRADWLLYAGAVYMQILWVSALIVNFRFLTVRR
jgi:phosphatidylglycerophosphate synthase